MRNLSAEYEEAYSVMHTLISNFGSALSEIDTKISELNGKIESKKDSIRDIRYQIDYYDEVE